jgi:enediyne biosynthesis protein E5
MSSPAVDSAVPPSSRAAPRPVGAFLRAALRDPRNLQICVLAILALYGALALDFVLSPFAAPCAIGAALVCEHALFRFRKDAFSPSAPPPYKSALISALSSLLLYRSTNALAYAAVAAIAVTSKTVLRVRGRHFVNPTNGAVLLGSLLLPGWIASGQWGHDVVLIFGLAACASLVLSSAARLDSALAFIGGTLFVEMLRHFIFGYPWAVTVHHFTNGAFWLFALYMITDPKTTPRAKSLRIVHGILVAVAAISMAQFFYVRDAFLWALLALAPIVPIFDGLAQRQKESSASTTASTPTAIRSSS